MEQQLLQQSLRLRYEAFSNFAATVSRAESLEEVAHVLALHAKYIVPVYGMRFAYWFENQQLILTVFRGEVGFCKPGDEPGLDDWEKSLLAKQVPVSYAEEALCQADFLKDSFFDKARIQQVYSLPLQLAENHQLVFTLASKEAAGFSEPDYRFIRLLAEQLANKFSQLLLLRKLEKKQEELAAANLSLNKLNGEIQELNEQLGKKVEERTQAFQQANDELNTLFYRSSHDFRRPLTTVLGLMNLARQYTNDHELLEIFQYCDDTINSMNRMLIKLKELSDASQNVQPVRLSDIIGRAWQRNNALVEESGACLLQEAAVHSEIRIDPDVLEAVLENLFENCLIFRSGQPEVRVSSSLEDRCLKISIADNGTGILPEYLPRVCDMYFSASELTRGNGLGLYVVKKLVEKQSGSLNISTEPGKGTQVELNFPLS